MEQNIILDQKKDRGQATRQHIITIATRLFSEQGYEQTSIEAVLQACEISRGALYHHFSSKEVLFTAVLEAVEEQIIERVREAGQDAGNPLDALRAGCAAWLQMTNDAKIRQIVLLDAPSVIGWQAWRALDERYGLGLLKAGLGTAAAMGRMRAEMVDTYAHILLAVLTEVSLMITRSENTAAAIETGQEAIEQVISRFFSIEPHGKWE